ncbi:MAG: succinylglutamate desuccinylase/aspartoacylase family protein [Acidobacteriota bacterium]
MSVSPVHCSAPLDAAHGKYPGHLAIPYSYNLGGWANLLVPICVIANGPGPTVLLMAGNHGDEYPGQVAIHHLWRQLEPEQVTGRLILIPTLSPPAAQAATRLWPLDGRNFNRCFPGDPAGSPSQVLAHFLSSVLLPLADVVIDLHTGGRSMNFVPCAHMHLVDNPAMFAATEAFLTEFCFLYTDVAGAGLLPTEAERQGKLVITTELGGGETVTASLHRLTQKGLGNVLRHIGVVDGAPAPRQAPARWVQSLDREDYRFAPVSGLFEATVDLGGAVGKGDVLGRIHDLEDPSREPALVIAPSAGLLIANRSPSMVAQGDCVAVIAHETNPYS